MDTRMSKYDSEVETASRVKKNASLYEEINNKEIDNFTLRSNATVLGKQEQEIDIEKIKKILDTKYNELPKRKSIRLETAEKEKEEDALDSPTKEYDLNAVIDKAKEEKQETYEQVRAKKLRDTQFDILNNLHINSDEEKKDEPKAEDNDLLNLINTITINEEKEKQKKDDKIEESKKEEQLEENLLEQQEKNLIKEETITNSIDEIKDEIKKIENTSSVINKTSNLDDSFYTSSNLFKKKDFSDDDDDKLSMWVKILILVIVLCIIVGMYFFIKSIIDS